MEDEDLSSKQKVLNELRLQVDEQQKIIKNAQEAIKVLNRNIDFVAKQPERIHNG
jgi:hypothetical protein